MSKESRMGKCLRSVKLAFLLAAVLVFSGCINVVHRIEISPDETFLVTSTYSVGNDTPDNWQESLIESAKELGYTYEVEDENGTNSVTLTKEFQSLSHINEALIRIGIKEFSWSESDESVAVIAADGFTRLSDFIDRFAGGFARIDVEVIGPDGELRSKISIVPDLRGKGLFNSYVPRQVTYAVLAGFVLLLGVLTAGVLWWMRKKPRTQRRRTKTKPKPQKKTTKEEADPSSPVGNTDQ